MGRKEEKPDTEDLDELFQDILNSLSKSQRGFVSFKKLRSIHGYCDFEEEEICIDWRKEFIATAIHEMLHFNKPEWSESKVMKFEKKIINHITEEDVVCLLKILVKKI